MFDIKFLKSTGLFKVKTLLKNEVLFEEGDTDDNLYIIEKGDIHIEKYISSNSKHTKQLAILHKGNFIGEGSMLVSSPKKVRAVSIGKTTLIYINSQSGFEEFLNKHSREAKNILVSIIYTINQRVSDANAYITSMYAINKSIKEIKNIDFKEVFKILDQINVILNGDFLLFLEKNSVMGDYLSLKYDSRFPGKMQDIIVKKGDYSLEEINISEGVKIITKEISIGKEVLGSIIIGRNETFLESEKRTFLGIINSIAGVLKQKQMAEEERDKEYLSRNKY